MLMTRLAEEPLSMFYAPLGVHRTDDDLLKQDNIYSITFSKTRSHLFYHVLSHLERHDIDFIMLKDKMTSTFYYHEK